MSDAVGSQNVVIKMGTDGSPGSLAAIAEVTNIDGPNPDSEQIDVTHLNSPNRYREWIQSFKDAGQVSGKANFLASHISGVIAAFDDGVERDFTILFPLTGGNKTASFGGFMKTYGNTVAVGEKIPLSFTIKITGAVSWA